MGFKDVSFVFVSVGVGHHSSMIASLIIPRAKYQVLQGVPVL